MKASGSKTEDDFRDFLKSQGVSLDMLRRQWERNFMAMEYLRSMVHPYQERVGPQQIRDYYEKHPDEFQRPDSVQWQDLFVEAERYPSRDEARRFAEEVAERARKGEDFAKLAEQYDNGDSSFRKGEGIGSKHGEIKPPEAETTLFQMKDGEVDVVELETGFHVVRVIKRVEAGLVDFDEKTQKRIKDKLGNETAQLEMKRIVSKLKREAVIVYSKARVSGRRTAKTPRTPRKAISCLSLRSWRLGGSFYSLQAAGAQGDGRGRPSRGRQGVVLAQQRLQPLLQLVAARLELVALAGAAVDLLAQVVPFLDHELAGLDLLLQLGHLFVHRGAFLLQRRDALPRLVAGRRRRFVIVFELVALGLEGLDLLRLGGGLARVGLRTAPNADGGHEQHDQRITSAIHRSLLLGTADAAGPALASANRPVSPKRCQEGTGGMTGPAKARTRAPCPVFLAAGIRQSLFRTQGRPDFIHFGQIAPRTPSPAAFATWRVRRNRSPGMFLSSAPSPA